MQNDLLFEIGTEEIPAGYISPAINSMQDIVRRQLAELELSFSSIKLAATPRRLAICVQGLADRQEDKKEEAMGPPKKAAFDSDNNPTKAALGFAKSRGVDVSDLKIASTEKGEYLMVVVEKKGQATLDLLPDLLNNLISDIPFPKSMRWGAGKKSFARPVQWLLALYGDEVIPCRINDINSANMTRGHRFMANTPFAVNNFNDYLEKLQRAKVIADPDKRRAAVISEIESAAGKIGGNILPDPELIDTVTNLVETPHAICGSFDPKFLQLPREVLITSMREHQKYFAIQDNDGKLLANFIAVNNTITTDTALAAEGHQRVIRARLEDAFFFFKEDRNHKLADRVEALAGVVFQAELGSMLEKTTRITELTAWLTAQIAPELETAGKRAAHLAKADLLTDMVNEFPSLQGIMGRAYAELDQEAPEVAAAISDHYLPVRAGDRLPSSTIGALVGLADRIDTITGCFGIGKRPTGTTDPYGLRRLAIAIIHILEDKKLTISLAALIEKAISLYGPKLSGAAEETASGVIDFIRGRYTNDKTSKDTPLEAIEAVTCVDFDDIIDCNKRINALVAANSEPTFAILAGSFKRVRNIIKDNNHSQINEDLLVESAEKQLHAAFTSVADQAGPLLNKGDYQAAMTIILQMKEPVDNFFDDVMVMAEDKKIQENRLALLTAISKLFLQIGDFSRMSALAKPLSGKK